MIEFRIRDRLKNDVAVAAIVGDRIHPVRVPRMDLETDKGPKVTYRRVSGGREHTLSSATGKPMPLFEFMCWSRSYDEAKNLAVAIRNCMDGFGPGDFGDVVVHSVRNVDEEDVFWEPEDGSDEGWYAVALKYSVRATEALPNAV